MEQSKFCYCFNKTNLHVGFLLYLFWGTATPLGAQGLLLTLGLDTTGGVQEIYMVPAIDPGLATCEENVLPPLLSLLSLFLYIFSYIVHICNF